MGESTLCDVDAHASLDGFSEQMIILLVAVSSTEKLAKAHDSRKDRNVDAEPVKDVTRGCSFAM